MSWSNNANFLSCCLMPSTFQIIAESQMWHIVPVPAASISGDQMPVQSFQTDVPPHNSGSAAFPPPLSPDAGPVIAVISLSSHSLMGGGGDEKVEGSVRICVCEPDAMCSPRTDSPSVRLFFSHCHNQLPSLPFLWPLWEKNLAATKALPAVLPWGIVVPDKLWKKKKATKIWTVSDSPPSNSLLYVWVCIFCPCFL